MLTTLFLKSFLKIIYYLLFLELVCNPPEGILAGMQSHTLQTSIVSEIQVRVENMKKIL